MCKQLGFSGVSQATSVSFFGIVEPSFSYDDVVCNGSENVLYDCLHNDKHNCGGGEAAGVVCV